jgi:LmbE family N-acetylglucosaminyl deacetylase
MQPAAINLSAAAIVAAHPDDEILWFASLVAKVRRVILCYGEVAAIPVRAAQRRNLAATYPLDTLEFLDLVEPGDLATDAEAQHRQTLAARLSPLLAGITTVFTHNPWGEYGHPDHRRVNAVVNSLSRELNYAVYVSAYVAKHRLREFHDGLDGGIADVVTFPVSVAAIEPIFALYKLHRCWTWALQWQWPEREHFMRLSTGAQCATAFPFHLFDVDDLRSRAARENNADLEI